jgi:hypothetical protein
MTDQLRAAVDLLIEVLVASPFGVKDIGGSGYRVHRDGTFAGYYLDDGRETEWPCAWAEVAEAVSISDVTDAIDELLRHTSVQDDLLERFRATRWTAGGS